VSGQIRSFQVSSRIRSGIGSSSVGSFRVSGRIRSGIGSSSVGSFRVSGDLVSGRIRSGQVRYWDILGFESYQVEYRVI
jgi:hypothetical protein